MSRSAATYRKESLLRLGLNPNKWDILIALAGNPNVGKSTVFNALTGLRQHTGNWPGKTIVRAEGAFAHRNKRIKLVDLPGTYSLQAGSVDEEVAREFVLFGRPDVTVVVVDATRLERNLNLALQILDITNRVIVYLNLTDEARRHGIGTDPKRLEQQLGVPVITGVARSNIGINELLDAAHDVATGSIQTTPYRIARHDQSVEQAVASLTTVVEETFPGLPSSRWVSQRLLTADDAVIDAVRSGELGRIGDDTITGNAAEISEDNRSKVLSQAQRLRWELPDDFQDKITEHTFHAAEQITAASQVRGLKKTSVDIDWALDRLLTNRWVGFPVMLLILAAVFWITIEGANVPSAMLASLLIDTLHPLLRAFGESTGLPWWANGFLFDGVYLATAWVVAVMLPEIVVAVALTRVSESVALTSATLMSSAPAVAVSVASAPS
ncbi:MAG: FeoB small GTPase domain-containing protein, partial [Vicinamibacterales bacterium]